MEEKALSQLFYKPFYKLQRVTKADRVMDEKHWARHPTIHRHKTPGQGRMQSQSCSLLNKWLS